jgi:hypothetical protein
MQEQSGCSYVGPVAEAGRVDAELYIWRLRACWVTVLYELVVAFFSDRH